MTRTVCGYCNKLKVGGDNYYCKKCFDIVVENWPYV